MSQPPYNPQDPYGQYGQGQSPYPPQQQYGPPQGQPPYPPGPYGYQPQPPPKPGRSPLFWLFVVGLPLVLLFSCTAGVIILGTTASNTDLQQPPVAERPPAADDQDQAPASDNPPPTEQAEQAEQPAAVGAEVRDGQFAFTVTKFEKATRVGTEFLHKDAQGEFLIVHMTVKNIGDKPGHFFGQNQKLFDAQGREFSADSAAAIYFKDAKSLYEEINPGNQVNGVVLFDLPKGVNPTSIELHDSLMSGGVKVNLASGT